MSLDLLFHYLLLKKFRMLIHPSSGVATYCGFISCVVLVSLCCIGILVLYWYSYAYAG